ncbi:DEAD/DEAH box helicase family protein [Candidatus Pacearchaeota archaeon]|nr:DEAD/DEAH box helicase family protein [Candidatus Pacearchaeota archaeon]
MWNLYQKGEFLKPLKFSNGKTQEEVVKEVLESIKQGHKIIFIHGICGTGKSAIALNIARKLGKTSIVVPGKNLQNQYKKDYEGDKYLLKKDGGKLKISVITGRNNHKCKFLEDNQNAIPKIKKEINSKLYDIFSGKKEEFNEKFGKDISADNHSLPCKIEIKEKNWSKIKEYLKQNKKVNLRDFLEINDVKRASIAGVCPYWCPVLPDKYELKQFENANKKEYLGLEGTKFIFYQRKFGCSFYEQFNSFVNSDVIVFNSLKYKLESALNRKPLTEVEIIDECDEFLDSFANQREINLDRFQNSLNHVFFEKEENEKIKMELVEILKQIKRNKIYGDSFDNQEITPLRKTGIYDLFRIFLNSPEFLEEIDEESYVFEIEETARMFEDFFEESYVTFEKREESIVAKVITTNLEKKFKEIVEKNKIIVLMSGTLHSEEVLKDVFGLKEFIVIEAETEQQGRIEIQRTGLEIDCKYSNFSNGNHSRENYLKALDKCVEVAKKPVLVHVNAFNDLPSEEEVKELEIHNLISREKIKGNQIEDKTGEIIEKFKRGEEKILFSTRCARGIDFPGEECNSIVFTKYPNPNPKDAFWKILMKTKPQNYWEFYKDKARRELWQKIYRGLRFKEDHIYLLSPDSRVLEAFEGM